MTTQTPATSEIEKWLRVRFFPNFWLRAGSGSEEKTQNPAGVDSCNPDLVPPLTDIGKVLPLLAVLPALRFSREFGLVFFWICVFLVSCGLLIFGLVLFKNWLFLGLFYANFLISGLLFWNCYVTFAVSISWKSIVYCLASGSSKTQIYRFVQIILDQIFTELYRLDPKSTKSTIIQMQKTLQTICRAC